MGLRASSRQLLRGTGQRVTSQRVLLLKLLKEGKGHMDADELYRQAKQKYPRISLSTVYRSLGLFKKLGLVEELHFEEEHHHYEGKPAREHSHVICLGCGRVSEFESPYIEAMKGEVASNLGFQVDTADVHLHGYCPDCRKGKEKEK